MSGDNVESLESYLTRLITPPAKYGPKVLTVKSFDSLDWRSLEDESLSGLYLTFAPVGENQTEEIMRVLKPGAHVCLVSSVADPLGNKGATAMEDQGFEVRDTIFVLDSPEDEFYYVAKAARKEREAGCESLPSRSGAEAVDREEGTAGLNNPRAGAGRTASVIRNHHVSVKPLALMRKLIERHTRDRQPGDVLVEPFMGSGTTVAAAALEGVSAIGIERETDYMAIAEARARHWARTKKFQTTEVTVAVGLKEGVE